MPTPAILIAACIGLSLISVSVQSADHAAGVGAGQTDSSQQAPMDAQRQREFNARSSEVRALLTAYRNINDEAGTREQSDPIEKQLSAQINLAELQYRSDNVQAGRAILDNAYATLTQAIIQLRDGKTLTRSRSADEQYDVKTTPPSHLTAFQTTGDSIDTLLHAFKRVSSEKGQTEQGAVMEGNIMLIKVNASKRYQAGDHAAANQLLKGAYTLIKEALAALREGDTLTQSLNFANKQEEYQYYLVKTESQQMAIEILLQVAESSSNNALLQNILKTSQAMLDQAAELAQQGDYESAVSVMEKVLARLQSGLMMSLSSR